MHYHFLGKSILPSEDKDLVHDLTVFLVKKTFQV